MGTWGVGSFENDQALDFVGELEGTHDLSLIEAALDLEDDDEDLDVAIGTDVVVASEIVAALMGKPGLDLPVGVSTWVEARRGADVSSLRPRAVDLLKTVLSDRSELRQLWDESAKDAPAWKGRVGDLITRLQG